MGKFLAKFRTPNYSASNTNYSTGAVTSNTPSSNSTKKKEMKLEEINNFTAFHNILATAASPNSTCVFGLEDFSLQLFDFDKNIKIKNWKGHDKDITKVLYCSKSNRYLSSSRDKTIKLWSMSNDRHELNILGHELVVTAIAIDPDNKFLISGSRDNSLKLWDLASGKNLTSAQISRNLITDVCWSQDGKILLQTSEDKETRLWDPINLKIVHSFPKKQYIQSSCHISHDNNYAISTSNGFQGNGCEITVWDLRKKSILTELIGHEQTVTCAKIVRSDKYIVSCGNDSTVKLWDLKNLRLIESIYLTNTLTSVCESFQTNNSTSNLIVSSLNNGIYTLRIPS